MLHDLFIKAHNKSVSLPLVFKRIHIDSLLRHTTVFVGNYILPIYFRLTYRKHELREKHNSKNNRKIIVSLTSFPARINSVWLVIESIMRQSLLPDKIILWLSKEQFPTIDTLPNNILAQCKRGLEIQLMENDWRSHKKYIYSFNKYPDDYVVLIDDDILYPSNFLHQLLEDMTPKKVHCSYAYLMKYDHNKELLPYIQWKYFLDTETEKKELFFGSGGGTVLVPSSLYHDASNIKLAYSLCPSADDVWLNAMCRLTDLKIIKTRGGLIYPITTKNSSKLCTENILESRNDIQINKVINYYTKEIGINPFLPYTNKFK